LCITLVVQNSPIPIEFLHKKKKKKGKFRWSGERKGRRRGEGGEARGEGRKTKGEEGREERER
jgi:hypothetical protein